MVQSLTLYHYWRSSCSWRVRWALALKGQAYEAVAINILAKEHQAPAFLAKNPAGFLPALAIDGQVFGESLAICEWINDTWPEPPLLPHDALGKMAVRQLALTIAAGTQPLQNPSVIAHYIANEAERAPHVRHWIERGLGVYEELLKRGKRTSAYSYGNHVTLADLCLVPQVYNARRFEVAVEQKFPRCAAIAARCLETAACDAAAPHRQLGGS